jgi:hypothetical protein
MFRSRQTLNELGPVRSGLGTVKGIVVTLSIIAAFEFQI